MEHIEYPIKFDIPETAIKALQDKFGYLLEKDVNKENIKDFKNAIKECRGLRTKIESRRKELKKPLLELGRKIDSTAKKLIKGIKEIEEPIKHNVVMFERAEQAAKEEAARKEKERLDNINAKIQYYRNLPASLSLIAIEEGEAKIKELEKDDLIWADEFRDDFLAEKNEILKKAKEYLVFLKQKQESEIYEKEKEREKKKEAAIQAMRKYCRSLKQARLLYEAIEQGEIPGIKII